MKEFKFEKSGLKCVLTINNNLNKSFLEKKISIETVHKAIDWNFDEDKIVFSRPIKIKGQLVAGFILDNMDEIKAAYQAEIDEGYNEQKRLFNAYLSGEEKIYMSPRYSTYFGDTKSYIVGFSVALDNKAHYEAEKAMNLLKIRDDDENIIKDTDRYYLDINIVKQHYEMLKEENKKSEELEEKATKRKAELLKEFDDWKTEKFKELQENGAYTTTYIHTFVINKNTIKVCERNIFDFGRVVAIIGKTNDELNADEAKCVEFVEKYSCGDDTIMM